MINFSNKSYITRAFFSVIPLILLLFSKYQELNDIGLMIVIVQLYSQLAYRIVSFDWHASVMKTQSFGLEPFKISLLFGILVFVIDYITLSKSLLLCTFVAILFLYFEAYFRSKRNEVMSLFFLSKWYFLIFFIDVNELFLFFVIAIVLLVLMHSISIYEKTTSWNRSRKERVSTYLNINIGYLTSNLDQLLVVWIMPQLSVSYAILCRVIKILEPLLFSYNQLTVLKHAACSKPYENLKVYIDQRNTNIAIALLSAVLSISSVFVLGKFVNIVKIIQIDDLSLVSLIICFFILHKSVSGSLMALTYSGKAFRLFPYESGLLLFTILTIFTASSINMFMVLLVYYVTRAFLINRMVIKWLR